MMLRVLIVALASWSVSGLMINPARGFARGVCRLRGGAPSMSAVAIVVDAEIEPSRIDEFLKVMEEDAKGSRKEKGCIRFDVMRASDTRFFFYEVYESAEAVDVHKAQPHFKLWSDFKASGGVVNSVSTKAAFPGDWGCQ